MIYRIDITSYAEKTLSISFRIEWDLIVVTIFRSILNQMDFHLVLNRKENYHHDHIPFTVKGNGNIVFSVHTEKPFRNVINLNRNEILFTIF